MADGKVVIDTALDLSGVESGVKKLDGLLKGGALLASMATIKAVVGDIARSTEALNSSIRKASTLFGSTSVNTKALAKNLTDLAKNTGFLSEELGEGLYNALSAGIPVTEDMAEATSFLEKSAKTAKGGFADLAETVTATAAVLNAYKLSVSETDRIQGILLQTQNLGITTVGQLAASLSQVVPTASAFGVSFEQVGAALASITAQGTPTAQATTALNGLMAELGKQSQQAAKNLAKATKSAGMGEKSFQDLIGEGYTLNDVLQLMADYAEDNGLTLIDMFGSIEGGRAALQLATGEGEKFNSALEAMSDTAGVVDNAFDKVFSNTDRLRTAFREAKKTLGNVFAPAVDSLTGSLADMLNGILDNRDRAKELNTALTDLETATENYRTAQKEAKDSTDELTQAMLGQSAVAYQSALLEMERQYDEAVKELPRIQKEIDSSNRKLQTAERVLDKMADTYGVTREKLAQMASMGELTKGDYDALVFQQRTDEVRKYKDEVTELTFRQTEANTTVEQFITASARAYKDGAIDLEFYKETNFGLYDAISRTAEGMKEGEAEAERLVGLYGDNDKELQKLIRTQTALADLFKDDAQKEAYHRTVVEGLTKAYEELNKTKSGSQGAGAGAVLKPDIDTEEIKRDGEEIDRIFGDLRSDMVKAGKVAGLLGEDYDETGQKIGLLERALVDLIDAGLDPADAKIQWIIGTLAKLKDAGEDASHTFDDFREKLAKVIEQPLTSSLTGGFRAMADTLANTGKRLEEIDTKNREMQDALQEAQDERQDTLDAYNDALARGNEEDAENAERKLEDIDRTIDGYKKLMKANTDEKKSLESGAEGWKAFGRAALSALGEVLVGIGAQLAAEAVLKLIKWDWSGAATATAGSVAAIAAGAGLKVAANSFEEGGIVQQEPGVPSTGDNHVVFTNPGELILNRAQQQNLADQMRASSQDLRGGGSSVTINLSGAYIYGLDEAEVGRAIYRNIRTLQAEGTL